MLAAASDDRESVERAITTSLEVNHSRSNSSASSASARSSSSSRAQIVVGAQTLQLVQSALSPAEHVGADEAL
jgi:hypothetical protein